MSKALHIFVFQATTGVQLVAELVSGQLNLSFTDLSNTMLQTEIGHNLHNGDWYQLDVITINESGLIMVELRTIGNNIGFLPVQQNITSSPGTLVYGPVLLGSVTGLSSSFVENANSFGGCVRMLYINEMAVNLIANQSYALNNFEFAIPGCPREENCYPDPCANDGICMSTWNNFSCSCLTDFSGTNCSKCKLFIVAHYNNVFTYCIYIQLLQYL